MEREFVKVNYAEYESKYDQRIIEKMAAIPKEISVDAMRACLYGYTFTEDYARMRVLDELSMDYWRDRNEELAELDPMEWKDDQIGNVEEMDEMDEYITTTPQEKLLLQTIDSTGDGLSPETALCVIDVYQEYEYLERVSPYFILKLERQSECNGIDCLEFEPNAFNVERIYFDVNRRFEVGYFTHQE